MAWCKEVRKAVSNDKEKWWNGVMAMLEEDLRWNGQGDIFKKLKRLNGSKIKPVDLVLIHTFQQRFHVISTLSISNFSIVFHQLIFILIIIVIASCSAFVWNSTMICGFIPRIYSMSSPLHSSVSTRLHSSSSVWIHIFSLEEVGYCCNHFQMQTKGQKTLQIFSEMHSWYITQNNVVLVIIFT